MVLEKGLLIASSINHLPSMGFVELMYCLPFAIKGGGSNLKKHAERCMRHCEKGGVHLFLPWGTFFLGADYYFLREREKIQKYVKRGLQMQKDMGTQLLMPVYFLFLGQIQMELGNLKSAPNYGEKALEFAQYSNEKAT